MSGQKQVRLHYLKTGFRITARTENCQRPHPVATDCVVSAGWEFWTNDWLWLIVSVNPCGYGNPPIKKLLFYAEIRTANCENRTPHLLYLSGQFHSDNQVNSPLMSSLGSAKGWRFAFAKQWASRHVRLITERKYALNGFLSVASSFFRSSLQKEKPTSWWAKTTTG